MRTGRTEIGTGMSAFYAQVIAEELSVRPEAITLITGDTDKTPDGGYSAGFLTGAANLRKVAAYTYQALLGLGSEATWCSRRESYASRTELCRAAARVSVMGNWFRASSSI